jgi:hypothetical protein
MAINDRPDIRCEHLRHQTDDQAPSAVGVIRYGESVQTKPFRCQACINRLETDMGGAWDVVYLDPTRQRRPNPDDNNPAYVAHGNNLNIHYDVKRPGPGGAI